VDVVITNSNGTLNPSYTPSGVQDAMLGIIIASVANIDGGLTGSNPVQVVTESVRLRSVWKPSFNDYFFLNTQPPRL